MLPVLDFSTLYAPRELGAFLLLTILLNVNNSGSELVECYQSVWGMGPYNMVG